VGVTDVCVVLPVFVGLPLAECRGGNARKFVRCVGFLQMGWYYGRNGYSFVVTRKRHPTLVFASKTEGKETRFALGIFGDTQSATQYCTLQSITDHTRLRTPLFDLEARVHVPAVEFSNGGSGFLFF